MWSASTDTGVDGDLVLKENKGSSQLVHCNPRLFKTWDPKLM